MEFLIIPGCGKKEKDKSAFARSRNVDARDSMTTWSLFTNLFVSAFFNQFNLTTARSALSLYWRRLNFDLAGRTRRRWRSDSILDLGRHRHEGLFHVRRVLG